MQKFKRKPLTDIPVLDVLENNWQEWGRAYQLFLKGDLQNGAKWSWKQGIYEELRNELASLTNQHCSFCDGYPLGETSKETIEHYIPKSEAPLLAYCWENLYYCCDFCQSCANKQQYELTLRPDDESYTFDYYFYFDYGSGEIKVNENLEFEDVSSFEGASKFLERYGINTPKRNKARQHLYHDIRNFFKNSEDARIRDDFKYRHVFDFVEMLLNP